MNALAVSAPMIRQLHHAHADQKICAPVCLRALAYVSAMVTDPLMFLEQLQTHLAFLRPPSFTTI